MLGVVLSYLNPAGDCRSESEKAGKANTASIAVSVNLVNVLLVVFISSAPLLVVRMDLL
jgi:hypothetical protein